MSDASVRTARTNDLPAVGQVQAKVWRAAFADLVETDTLEQFAPRAFERAWRDSMSAPPSPLHRLLVATELDQVVGFVAIGPAPDAGSGDILAGGVSPKHRGKGHGSRLLNAAIDTLAANDIHHVRVRIVERDTPLVRFLAVAGFVASGAYADRVVTSTGGTVREIELHTSSEQPAPQPSEHDHEHEHGHHPHA